MKLFGQILVIAICVYATSGVSISGIVNSAVNAADNVINAGESAAQSIINKIENIIHGGSNNPSGVTADTCYANYNTQLSSINNLTVSQSQSCYLSAESSMTAYTENLNSSLNDVNALSQELQSQLAACAANLSMSDVFSCYISTFDENLKNLDDLTVQSQLAIAYLNGFQSQLDVTQSGCVSSVILISKANSTTALNTLEDCLDSVSNAANTNSNSNSASSSSSSSSDSQSQSQSSSGSSSQSQSQSSSGGQSQSSSSSNNGSGSQSSSSSSTGSSGTGSQLQVQIF